MSASRLSLGIWCDQGKITKHQAPGTKHHDCDASLTETEDAVQKTRRGGDEERLDPLRLQLSEGIIL